MAVTRRPLTHRLGGFTDGDELGLRLCIDPPLTPRATKPFPYSLDRAIQLSIDSDIPPASRVAGLYPVSAVRAARGSDGLNIVIVTAGDLNFAAKPGEYEVHQLVVVFKTKAFLPADAHPVFADLGNKSTLGRETGFRVDFHLDRGLQCQGLIMPVDKFPEIVELLDDLTEFYSGCQLVAEQDIGIVDVESLLGVKRWDPAARMTDVALGPTPKFYRKPKFPRLHECPNLFIKGKYNRLTYQETLKMDGSSMAIYFVTRDSPFYQSLNPLRLPVGKHMDLENGRFGVCSMNRELDELDDSPYWKVALQYDLPAILNAQNQDWVVQGELVGWQVNGNRHGYARDTHDLFVFDIWEPRIQKCWLGATWVVQWCEKHGVQHVPVKGHVKITEIAKSHEDLQARADGVDGEGIVFKCLNRPNRRFKVHNRHYLEKHGLN